MEKRGSVRYTGGSDVFNKMRHADLAPFCEDDTLRPEAAAVDEGDESAKSTRHGDAYEAAAVDEGDGDKFGEEAADWQEDEEDWWQEPEAEEGHEREWDDVDEPPPLPDWQKPSLKRQAADEPVAAAKKPKLKASSKRKAGKIADSKPAVERVQAEKRHDGFSTDGGAAKAKISAEQDKKGQEFAAKLRSELQKVPQGEARLAKLAQMKVMIDGRKTSLLLVAGLTHEKLASLTEELGSYCLPVSTEQSEPAPLTSLLATKLQQDLQSTHTSFLAEKDEKELEQDKKAEEFACKLRSELQKVPQGKARIAKLAELKAMMGRRKSSLLSVIGLTEAKLALLTADLESCSLPDCTEGWVEVQDSLFGTLPPLPAGWIRIRSRSQDLIYFYNVDTQASTKEEPKA